MKILIFHTLISTILFTSIIYSLGLTLTFFSRKNSFELIVSRLGIGIGAFPVLGLIFNTLKIPLDWRIFLCVSLSYPVYHIIKKKRLPKLSFQKIHFDKTVFILLIIFAITLFVYCWGPFQYPWLEDDDPWSHAAVARFIATEKTIDIPSGTFQYLNPYPPAYGIIMGVMHQIHPSIYWILKFFNGLIISLGILFFYFFANEFTKNPQKSLLATFCLATIPCYLSHFIWAHSLIITLFFPAFYCILKLKDDKRFILPASIVIAGILITQPTQSVKFVVLLFLFWGSYCLILRKLWKKPIVVLIFAVLISLLWWGPVIKGIKDHSLKLTMRTTTQDLGDVNKSGSFLKKLFSPTAGTATRAYTPKDFFFAPHHNLINNPIGIGIQLCLLSIFGIFLMFYKLQRGEDDEKVYSLTILLWLLFTFLGVNSMTFNLPVGLAAFRFWMLLAIPVSFLAAETLVTIYTFITNPRVRILAFSLLIASIASTSGYAKFKINTALWPPGVEWGSREEVITYAWLRLNLPKKAKVFAFTKNRFVIGNDMHADYWNEEYKNAFKNAIDLNIEELHSRLKQNNFEYIIVGAREVQEFGKDRIIEKVKAFNESPVFEFIYGRKNGARIYKIRDGEI